MRKSTVRNDISVDFVAVFPKDAPSKLNSEISAADPIRYQPSEVGSGPFKLKTTAKVLVIWENGDA